MRNTSNYYYLDGHSYCVQIGSILFWLPWYCKDRPFSCCRLWIVQSLSVHPDSHLTDGVGGEGQKTDVCGVGHSLTRLPRRYHKVGVFWISDEHERPLVESRVSEGEHVVVDG